VLANLENGHTRADVLAALEIVRATGIAFRRTWVAFTPWTTLDDYLDVLEFVEAEGPIDHVDPVQYTIRLLVPPGSALLDRTTIRPFLALLDQASFSYRWTHPDPRMDRLHGSICRMVEEATQAEEDPAVTGPRARRDDSWPGAQCKPQAGTAKRAAPAAPAYRAVVLLSRAHRGPVRPSAAGHSGRVVRETERMEERRRWDSSGGGSREVRGSQVKRWRG
jgi:hypothetical protein